MLQTAINKLIAVLQKGGTILYPTDTVWGIGCDATNAEAVQKIYTIKQRAESKALIILLDSAQKLPLYVQHIPAKAFQIIETASRPTTIIYPHAQGLAPNLIANDGSIAIRVTSDPFCKHLIAAYGKPIVSTSANVSGEATPSTFSQISNAIKNGVDYVTSPLVETPKGTQATQPSTILKIEATGEISVIRA